MSLSTKRPRKGVAVTAALEDPDGVVDESARRGRVAAQQSAYNEWAAIAGADLSSYTPAAADAGSFLRVSVRPTATATAAAREAQATAPEVVAAAQLSGLSISTNDSIASTEAWRRMRPAFNAQTLHYSVGCNEHRHDDADDEPRPTGRAGSRSTAPSTPIPGANTSMTATRAVTGNSVVRIALADAEGAQTQYVVHCPRRQLRQRSPSTNLRGETKRARRTDPLFSQAGRLVMP